MGSKKKAQDFRIITADDHACFKCKYDLSGLPDAHACPECGFEYDPHAIAIARDVRRAAIGQIAVGGAWLSLILVVALIQGKAVKPLTDLTFVIPLILLVSGLFSLWFGRRLNGLIINNRGLHFELSALREMFPWTTLKHVEYNPWKETITLFGHDDKPFKKLPRIGDAKFSKAVVAEVNRLAKIYLPGPKPNTGEPLHWRPPT